MDELKPCPFCGAKVKAEQTDYKEWRIECDGCYCSIGYENCDRGGEPGGYFNTFDELKEFWNKRHTR